MEVHRANRVYVVEYSDGMKREFEAKEFHPDYDSLSDFQKKVLFEFVRSSILDAVKKAEIEAVDFTFDSLRAKGENNGIDH